MRRRIVALACASAFLLVAASRAADAVVVSGHPNWPPFSWQAGETIVGVGAELASDILTELDVPAIVQARGNWKRVQEGARSGEVDLIVAAYRTDERSQFLTYPVLAYSDDANVVWVKRGRAFPFHRWDDLIGKRGTAMLGESYGEAFDAYIREHLNVDWVNTPAQNLMKLRLERADYYPFSLYGGRIQVAQLGYGEEIEPLPQPISTEGVFLAISKQSPLRDRLPDIEAALAVRRADGRVDALVKKYIERAVQAEPIGP